MSKCWFLLHDYVRVGDSYCTNSSPLEYRYPAVCRKCYLKKYRYDYGETVAALERGKAKDMAENKKQLDEVLKKQAVANVDKQVQKL